MRKFGQLVAAVVAALLLIIFLSPLIIGAWVKHNYNQMISFYNGGGNVTVKVLEYQSSGYSAEAKLLVEVLNLPEPLSFTVNQHIQYGPVIITQPKHKLKIELAAIHNQVTLSPETRTMIEPENLNDPLLQLEDDLGFLGKYQTHFHSDGFKILFSDPDKQIFVGPFTGDSVTWLNSSRFKGSMNLSSITYNSRALMIAAPELVFMYDERRAQSGLWLGHSDIMGQSVTIQDGSGKTVEFTQFQTVGDMQEDKGLLNGSKRFEIKKMRVDEVELGPLELALSIHDLNANALLKLIVAYRSLFNPDEKTQFAQPLFSLIPALFSANSSLRLDNLRVVTQDGDILLNGEVRWPKAPAPLPQNLKEVLAIAEAKGLMQISVVLTKELLGFAADLNYIGHRLSNPELAFLESQRNVATLEKQNALLVAVLIQDNQLPKDIGMQLLEQIRAKVTYEDYSTLLTQLFAAKKISQSVMEMLRSQYEKIKVADMSPDERLQYLEDQFTEKFNRWVKDGFITQKDKDYIISVTYREGAIKMNGKNI